MSQNIMDQIDKEILKILHMDSRLSHKEIGDKVHRTGQAVGNRVTRLIEQNIIQKYTIETHNEHTQFIRIMMKEPNFNAFETFITQFYAIHECYKVAGSACYTLIAHFNPEELHQFIEKISIWGTYSIDHVIRKIDPK
ncbi:AsnC family protein [Acinetobacter sp. ANC 4558]|uniref:Lrp/AsnC family transcriptional regulator n=1 Tax=Acinetobacter sp. ANC 4558 TaxID=1977876 RepID=UPI000A342E77|nr:AsnC family transcriptional regulator [Acinetobacter sp. ANC 4558]OTG80093.1 AsnC family protein [Acinetobacter sp. ANC 4558]